MLVVLVGGWGCESDREVEFRVASSRARALRDVSCVRACEAVCARECVCVSPAVSPAVSSALLSRVLFRVLSHVLSRVPFPDVPLVAQMPLLSLGCPACKSPAAAAPLCVPCPDIWRVPGRVPGRVPDVL